MNLLDISWIELIDSPIYLLWNITITGKWDLLWDFEMLRLFDISSNNFEFKQETIKNSRDCTCSQYTRCDIRINNS